MTTPPFDPSAAAGDCRRAAALVAHHANDNPEGINAVLQEACEVDRVTDLFVALLDLYQFLVPELRSELGIMLMSDAVLKLAGKEHQ